MKNLSIKFKLWSNLALFIAFYLAMWLLSYYSAAKISDYLDSDKVEMMRRADNLREALKRTEDLLNDAAQLAERQLLADADAEKKVFLALLQDLIRLDPERSADYERTEKVFNTYYKSARKAAAIIMKDDLFSEELRHHARIVKESLPVLRRDVNDILTRSYDTFSLLLDRSTHVATLLVTQNFILLVTIVMLSVIVFPMIIHSIIKPIQKLGQATEEIAKGDLTAQAEVVSLDEIGHLALSFNRMTRALHEKSVSLERTTRELKSSLDIQDQMQSKIVEANRQLKDVNAKLMVADRHKSEFLASMSHELRTPLNAIINFSEQILEDWDHLTTPSDHAREACDMQARVLKNSRHLLSLINDLLDLAKIESGYMTLDLAPADLREVAADAIASVSSLAKAKNLRITLIAPDEAPMFSVDERRILQSLINLLSNAIKFTDTGEVTVAVEIKEGEGGLIRVDDTGAGIPEEFIDIIFDRFRQGDSGDSRKHAGTGLGLNLVKQFVELHGGTVTAANRPEGDGASFTIFLPLAPGEGATA